MATKQWGQRGADLEAVRNSGGAMRTVVGTSGADRDVARYRRLGSETRAPIALDQRRADQTRGLQMGALGTLESAAQGNAPSTAAIQGQMQRDQTVAQGTAALGAGRGVGAQVAAARGVGGAMGNQLVGSLAGTTMARANEANQDRNAFAGAVQGVRGQDIGAATTDAELMAKSRALDEARQQGYERLGWNTRQAELAGNMEWWRQFDERERQAEAADAADKANKIGMITGGIGIGAGLVTGGLSDRRTKHELGMGALGKIGGR